MTDTCDNCRYAAAADQTVCTRFPPVFVGMARHDNRPVFEYPLAPLVPCGEHKAVVRVRSKVVDNGSP